MRIYISGKITGTTDYMERFAKAEEYLKEKNYSVINPAKINVNLPKDTTYVEYMKMSITLLDMCDAIYLLDGWDRSEGATLERKYAKTLGKGIFYETIQTLEDDWKMLKNFTDRKVVL
jgi:hypothetical protein